MFEAFTRFRSRKAPYLTIFCVVMTVAFVAYQRVVPPNLHGSHKAESQGATEVLLRRPIAQTSPNSSVAEHTVSPAKRPVCRAGDARCIDCAQQLELCNPMFTKELRKHVRENYLEDCTPKLIRVPCDSTGTLQSESQYACKADFLIEEYDYQTQWSCLQRIAKSASQSDIRIPRIGHSVFFFADGNHTLKFHYHLSVLSLIRYLRPSVYFFWNDGLPSGRWWLELLQRVSSQNVSQSVGMQDVPANYTLRFYSVRRSAQKEIYGTRTSKFANYHASDVTRIEALVLFGGVYLDFDAFAVNKLDPLLVAADWVMGYELEWCCLNNGVLFGAPDSDFGKLWHCQYADGYNPDDFTHHSVWRPHMLAERCPQLIRREARSLNQPNNYGDGRRLLYGDGVQFDLSGNYVVHGWMWQYEQQDLLNPDRLRLLNFTMARIWRHIYYASPLR